MEFLCSFLRLYLVGKPLLVPQNVGFSHHAYWNNDVFTEIHNADLELVFNKLMLSDVEKNQTNTQQKNNNNPLSACKQSRNTM